MKIEKLNHSKFKVLLYTLILGVVLIFIIVFQTSKASYRTTQSINIASGKVSYSAADLNVVAIYLQDEEDEETYNPSNTIPEEGYILSDNSHCEVGEETINTISFNYENGLLDILGISQKGTKCYLYFDIKTKLPSGYVQLEYIESNTYINGPYFDTELSFPSGFRYVGIVRPLNPSVDGPIFGTSDDYAHNFVGLGNAAPASRRYFSAFCGTQMNYPTGYDALSNSTDYSLDISTIVNNIFVKINGISYVLSIREFGSSSGNNSSRSSSSAYMFTVSSSSTYTGMFRLTGPQSIYTSIDNTSLVAQFYPVKRNSDGKVGMYDIVRNKFYKSANSTEFIAGPEV